MLNLCLLRVTLLTRYVAALLHYFYFFIDQHWTFIKRGKPSKPKPRTEILASRPVWHRDLSIYSCKTSLSGVVGIEANSTVQGRATIRLGIDTLIANILVCFYTDYFVLIFNK